MPNEHNIKSALKDLTGIENVGHPSRSGGNWVLHNLDTYHFQEKMYKMKRSDRRLSQWAQHLNNTYLTLSANVV